MAEEEPLLENMRKIMPKILTFHTKNNLTEGTDLIIIDYIVDIYLIPHI